MSTFFSDYPHTDDETATAASRAALNGRRPDVADEPTPRGWRLNLLAAGSVAGVILLVVGGVCLGLLLGAQPESEGLTDAELWTQNTELMARSAFAVIALFLGAQTLLFVGAGYFVSRLYRARAAASALAEYERGQIVRGQREIVKALPADRVAIGELRQDVSTLANRIDAVADQLVDALGAPKGLRIVRSQPEQN